MSSTLRTTPGSPRVSVIVPAYNAEPFIRGAIDSILNQSYPAVEVIAVDDGSTDATELILRDYGSRVRYFRQTNKGLSRARNVGTALATGELLAYLDADDLMRPDKIEVQVDFLRRHRDVSLVLTDYMNFDTSGPAELSHFQTCTEFCRVTRFDQGSCEAVLPARTARAILIAENYAIAGSPLFSRDILGDSPFDESVDASADYELVYRLALSRDMGVVNRIGFERRLHQNNMSFRHGHILRHKALSRAALAERESDDELRRRLRRRAAKYYCALAQVLGRERAPARWSALLSAIRLGHPIDRSFARAAIAMFGGL